MISTARADYRSDLASSLVVNFHDILLLFVKAVRAGRKINFLSFFYIKLVKLIISQEILNFDFLCGNLLNEILIMFND
ncbi:hypothetical protein E5338_08685 [Limosilactobacillus reuteri]|uniref:Uncharacterized protein n=1 Tax=Limosilactobacillus reuteri TaxID=1598 RepID=A0A4S2DRF3_LIMRT|nr:hypothetical protein FOD75_01825 [Limosilactobacillus reuteri]TGY45057.1 hypothetical protein E5338_08685 [Limosilactobacillus reuteri]